jgi:peptidoglycan hydrolase-like protein with peptidoglycan-binding domain
MQEALGLGADGIFGPGTERSLKAWQLSQGLEADGVAGAKTLGKLLG